MLRMNQSAFSIQMLRKLYKLRYTLFGYFWVCFIHSELLVVVIVIVVCFLFAHTTHLLLYSV